MRSLILLLAFLAGLVFTGFTQSKKTLYFDAEENLTSKANASFYLVITADEQNKKSLQIEGFYITGEKRLKTTYLSDLPVDSVNWKKLNYAFPFGKVKKEGAFNQWYKNGKLMEQGTHQNGVKEGTYRQWYESGNLLSEYTLIDGKEEGTVSIYYENGQPKMQYHSKNGLIDGILTEWYPDGSTKAEVTFLKGELVETKSN